MPKHLTVRMAWHDNNWDGNVCQKPEKNHYCVGTHSLLSETMKRKRNLEIETKNAGKRLDGLGDYVPPCYYTSNAFSDHAINVWHEHPFRQYEKTHRIPEKLSGYSVFTWPFRLSFNHDKKNRERYGQYPPDLEDRIGGFIDKFTPGETIVFFYLNYDNPISADENRYVLVGCATLNRKMTAGKHHEFDEADLARIRKNPNNRHFPTLHWTINTSYDFENGGVLLPYKEYLDHAEANPQDDCLLDEMRILIEEEDMVPNFKYVASDMDDDACIYLLTRMRRSLLKIKEHAIVEQSRTKRQIEIIDMLLERSWRLRGIYPGLGNVLDVLSDNDAPEDRGGGDSVVSLIRENGGSENVLEAVFGIISGNSEIPGYLKGHEAMLRNAQVCLEPENEKLLKKLSLFSFTHNQIGNILNGRSASFKTGIDPHMIEQNPYLLCEEYLPYGGGDQSVDEVTVSDRRIGTFAIDVGMFPDPAFLTRDTQLQNLRPNSPQRLRAIIRDYLKSREVRGDCYAPLDWICNHIEGFPLFYRDKINLSRAELVSAPKYLEHFGEKLKVVENGGDHYFYLGEVHRAEQLIREGVLKLLSRDDHRVDIPDLDGFLEGEAKQMSDKIPDFPKESFITERKRLVEGAMAKSLYVISGRPGSGKTLALQKVIKEIKRNGENVTVLAPTGKASLRLRNAVGRDTGAQTIDRKIHSEGYTDIMNDFEVLMAPKTRKEPIIHNLIIDESSMVNLKRLAVLFKMITDKKGEIRTKRIIFVGDENQLPPIGYGKPFFDMIQSMRRDGRYGKSNFVELRTNCRQRFDNEVIRVAEAFKGGNRYYEDVLKEISSGRFESPGFAVKLWRNEGDLTAGIRGRLGEVIGEQLKLPPAGDPAGMDAQLNLLFGLTDTGDVKNGDLKSMKLERLQIITPYRGSYFGTLGINDHIKSSYRNHPHPLEHKIYGKQIPFVHSDKIMCVKNQYEWDWNEHKNKLVLSNGSMGVVNNVGDPYPRRRFFFSDYDMPLDRLKNQDEYELAYCITVHKSQGSEFEHTFVVIPDRSALLSRELVYTALTRSTGKVTLFLQTGTQHDILEGARRRSDIMPRLTSVFSPPEDHRGAYEPRKGVFVRSKTEYILFKELEDRGVDFAYEKPREFVVDDGKTISFRPDFTIRLGGKECYLEHLGMLDIQEYSEHWKRRRRIYEQNGLGDRLVTTDELNGIRREKVTGVVEDLAGGNLKSTGESEYSRHHYALY